MAGKLLQDFLGESETSDFGEGQGDTEDRGSPSMLVSSRCTEQGDLLGWQRGELVSRPAHRLLAMYAEAFPGFGLPSWH